VSGSLYVCATELGWVRVWLVVSLDGSGGSVIRCCVSLEWLQLYWTCVDAVCYAVLLYRTAACGRYTDYCRLYGCSLSVYTSVAEWVNVERAEMQHSVSSMYDRNAWCARGWQRCNAAMLRLGRLPAPLSTSASG
jgi:hypothetical protein